MASNDNADISSQTIASTFDQLLHIGDSGNLSGCSAGNEKYIVDGGGTASTLSIGTTRVGIGTAAPTALLTVGAITTLLTDGTTAVTPEGVNVHITEASTYAMGIKNADASGDGLIIQAGDASDDFALRVEDYDSANNLLVVQGGGNVGIGTDDPGTVFHVKSTGPYLLLENSSAENTDGGRESRIDFKGQQDGNEITTLARIQGQHDGSSDDEKGDLIFYTNDGNDGANPTERMRIDSAGTVDIEGTTLNLGTSAGADIYMGPDDSNQVVRLSKNADGDLDILTNAGTLHIDVTGQVGIGTESPDDLLHVWAGNAGSFTANAGTNVLIEDSNSNYLEFASPIDQEQGILFSDVDAATGSITYNHDTDNMTIDADDDIILTCENVGIGYNAPGQKLVIGDNTSGEAITIELSCHTDASTNLVYTVNHADKWTLGNTSADVLYVFDHGDSSIAASIATTQNDWQAGSDLRIKKDINNIDSVLAGINSLRPITWKRKYGKIDKAYPGLVAQEVLPHFPLVIGGTEDSFKEITKDGNLTYEGGFTISYNNLVPYLIKAIQELSAKVTALENA